MVMWELVARIERPSNGLDFEKNVRVDPFSPRENFFSEKHWSTKSEENGTENAHTRVERVSSFEISQVFPLKKFMFTKMWMEISICLSKIGKAVVHYSIDVFHHSAHLRNIQTRRKSRLGRFQAATIQNEEFSNFFPFQNVGVGIKSRFDQEHELQEENIVH